MRAWDRRARPPRSDRPPRTSTMRRGGRDQEGDTRGAPEPARTELVHERAGDRHSEPEDGVVRGHDHGEHASPKLVRGSALDEQRIADDGDAVAEAADEHSDHREHERRRHRRDPEADRHQRDRAGVTGPRPESIEQRGRRDAADRQTEARRSDEQAEAHVSRVERDLREHDLPDVDGGVPEKDDVPDDRGPRRAFSSRARSGSRRRGPASGLGSRSCPPAAGAPGS